MVLMRSIMPVLAAVVCVTAALVAGCRSDSAAAPAPVTSQDAAEQATSTAAGMAADPAGPITTVPSTTTRGAVPSTLAARTSTAAATTPARFIVVLDPGHNGGNGAH